VVTVVTVVNNVTVEAVVTMVTNVTGVTVVADVTMVTYGIFYAGSYAGAVVGMPLSGLLTGSLGWEAPFYVYGK